MLQSLTWKVFMKQTSHKQYHDMHANDRDIGDCDEKVYFRNYGAGDKYTPGTIHKRTDPVSE